MKTLKSTLTQLTDKRKANESGMTLVEILIAAIIIVIILVATGAGFTTAFNASSSSENQNKATQMISDTMAIAQQSNFAQLGLATPTAADTEGCSNWSTTFNGEAMVVTSTPYDGLVYCQPRKYSNVGITFYIETRITYVNTTSFDSSSQANTIDGQHSNPKRITVTVRWSESANSSGTAIVSSLSISSIKTPSTSDCIPPGLDTGTTVPPGCN